VPLPLTTANHVGTAASAVQRIEASHTSTAPAGASR